MKNKFTIGTWVECQGKVCRIMLVDQETASYLLGVYGTKNQFTVPIDAEYKQVWQLDVGYNPITGTQHMYPMYFRNRAEDIKTKGHWQYGKAWHEVAVEVPYQPGDHFIYRDELHQVQDVAKQRPARGEHTIPGVVFQRLNTTFKRPGPAPVQVSE